MPDMFYYGDQPLGVSMAFRLATSAVQGGFSSAGRARIQRSFEHVKQVVEEDKAVYGINTGFGPLCNQRINKADLRALQMNLLRSHAVGVGADVSPLLVRLMMVLKLQALALGYSGVSFALLERLLFFLSQGLSPRVPAQGSLGASGDLAPLAHMALPLIGEGELWDGAGWRPAAEVLASHQFTPLVLAPKEGLALINGTQFIAAHAVLVDRGLHTCLEQADIVAALGLEGYAGSAAPYQAAFHELRPYQGAQLVAYRMRLLLESSEVLASHAGCDRVQDPYSFRCIPQVHGASRDAASHLHTQLSCELASVTDNPVLLANGEAVSGGHFHGQPLALPLDYVAIAASELANISERRSYLLSHGGYQGVPPLLVAETGIHSGLMIPQYTAAALVSENKTLSHPASVDSIPTSLGQEDHVSMGAWGARKALQILENVEHVLAIELLYASQSFSFRRPLRSSKVLEAVYAVIREVVPVIKEDRLLIKDLQVLKTFIQSGRLSEVAQEVSGEAWRFPQEVPA